MHHTTKLNNADCAQMHADKFACLPAEGVLCFSGCLPVPTPVCACVCVCVCVCASVCVYVCVRACELRLHTRPHTCKAV